MACHGSWFGRVIQPSTWASLERDARGKSRGVLPWAKAWSDGRTLELDDIRRTCAPFTALCCSRINMCGYGIAWACQSR